MPNFTGTGARAQGQLLGDSCTDHSRNRGRCPSYNSDISDKNKDLRRFGWSRAEAHLVAPPSRRWRVVTSANLQKRLRQVELGKLAKAEVRGRQARIDLDGVVLTAVRGSAQNQIDSDVAAQSRHDADRTSCQIPRTIGEKVCHGNFAAEILETP